MSPIIYYAVVDGRQVELRHIRHEGGDFAPRSFSGVTPEGERIRATASYSLTFRAPRSPREPREAA